VRGRHPTPARVGAWARKHGPVPDKRSRAAALARRRQDPRPPACKSCSSVRTDRLRSYVRSVVAVAHDRCQDGVRDVSSKQGCGFKCLPLGPTEYLTFSDRSIAHHLLLIEQAPASARSEDCSRAKTAHAFAIVVFAGDLLRWPSDLPRRSSEVRDPEPVHSAGARTSRAPSSAASPAWYREGS
jgi:hypothetical protein